MTSLLRARGDPHHDPEAVLADSMVTVIAGSKGATLEIARILPAQPLEKAKAAAGELKAMSRPFPSFRRMERT